MAYTVQFTPAARRSLNRIPQFALSAAVEFVYGPLAENPSRVGKPLRGPLEGFHGARRGEYRVIYRILDERVEEAVRVEHRRDVYRS